MECKCSLEIFARLTFPPVVLWPLLIGGNELQSQPLTDLIFHLYVAKDVIAVSPPMLTTAVSLVQQLQPASVAIVSADLAIRLVEAGRVGEGRGNGVGVRGGGGVPRRRGQRPGVALEDGERGRAVVLIGDGGRSSPRSQGLSLGQLVPQLRHALLFLKEQIGG